MLSYVLWQMHIGRFQCDGGQMPMYILQICGNKSMERVVSSFLSRHSSKDRDQVTKDELRARTSIAINTEFEDLSGIECLKGD